MSLTCYRDIWTKLPISRDLFLFEQNSVETIFFNSVHKFLKSVQNFDERILKVKVRVCCDFCDKNGSMLYPFPDQAKCPIVCSFNSVHTNSEQNLYTNE